MGPTASGKTQLAIDLVKQYPFEIISVDSAMVYRGMDIGTAKPSPETLAVAPHRLIDIRDPSESYSAAQFCEDAVKEIKNITSENKIPLLVGGTMLYFRALQKGLSQLPSANSELRKKINEEAELFGWSHLHNRLMKVDPLAAKRIHPHDSQRIQRALEVYELSGKSISEWQQQNSFALEEYQIINLAVSPENRSILHERIAQRFMQMLATGFLDEVKTLMMRKDLTLEMPSMRSVGYRQAWQHLAGELTYDEMCYKAIVATRQLAKRQLTWLRHWPLPLTWFDSTSSKLFLQLYEFLEKNI